jgi:hypothetical protein
LQLGTLTVVVCGVRPFCLNPLSNLGWESVVAMLIMAFPEVRWMFGTIRGYEEVGDEQKAQLDNFRIAHGIANLFLADQEPLFDGTGLRDWVRGCATTNKETERDSNYLPRRRGDQIAVSLDDETPYSFLQAYAAYRFGFRAVTVNNAATADYLLGPNSTALPPTLVFEDIYISFPDGSPGMSWLDKNPEKGVGRATRWPQLERAKHRIFVTSGHRSRGDELKWSNNLSYIAKYKEVTTNDGREQHSCVLYKPYSGILRLWQESGLRVKLRWPDGATGRIHRGVAKDFQWPPLKSDRQNDDQGHSSPGVLLVIAESLIDRAERLAPNVRSVEDAIRGAVFATDALELLGGRTPTVAIQALQLKHHFEVVAECRFAGVEHHIQLEERFIEIERDVNFVSSWFGRSQQETASLNAELRILIDLLRVFRESALFDEEQACMRRARKLHRHIWLHRSNALAAIAFPFRWYLDFLLGSIPRFVGAIGFWLVLLTCLYAAAGNLPIASALHDAFIAFIAISPPPDPDPSNLVTAFAIILGTTHLGIFISHLYSLMARK